MQFKFLSKINSPKDIRGYSNDELLELCKEIRSYTIDTITEIGGHLAPTLGVVELSVALHHVFDTPKDKLVWDVGHQGYAHKLLTGRFNDFKTIRKFNGLSGFLKRSESDYDVIGAGHASTSISAALGIAEARRQKREDYRVAAIIGDGSMTGGLAFEGINNAGHLGKQFLVILNDNEMSISPNVGAISRYFTRLISNPLYNRVRNEFWDMTGKLPIARSKTRTLIKKIEESLKSLIVPGILFDELGFRYFGPIDGHDLGEVVNTLNNIKDIQNPVLLHILTKKGKGMVSLDMENREYHDDAVKFHAVKAGSNQEVQNKRELDLKIREDEQKKKDLKETRKKQKEQKLKEEEEAIQKDLEAQRIKEWEDKFDQEQKIKLKQELIREEKIEQRERLRRAIKEQEDKTLQDELFTRLDAFEVNETKKN